MISKGLAVRFQTTHADDNNLQQMLWRMRPEKRLTLAMVAGLGGDRQLTQEEQTQIDALKLLRGQTIYSDLLFTLMHRWFEPEEAEQVWNAILKHKYEVSAALNRNIRVTVAAVDYLYNICKESELSSIVDERSMWDVTDAAIRDSLTHLYNLPTFCMYVDTELARFKRYGFPVSMIIADVDDFKHFNDTHGHQQGNKVLRQIATLILNSVRKVDVCARWGGEEFAILLPQTDSNEARATAERIRTHVAAGLRHASVTISQGVASCPGDANSTESLLDQADKAMYRAKQAGKDRVALCCDPAPAPADFQTKREHAGVFPRSRRRAPR